MTHGQGCPSVPGCSGTTSHAAHCCPRWHGGEMGPDHPSRLSNGGAKSRMGCWVHRQRRGGHAKETRTGWGKPRGVHRVEVMENIPRDTQNSTAPSPGQPAPSCPSWLSLEQGGWPEPPPAPGQRQHPDGPHRPDPQSLTARSPQLVPRVRLGLWKTRHVLARF